MGRPAAACADARSSPQGRRPGRRAYRAGPRLRRSPGACCRRPRRQHGRSLGCSNFRRRHARRHVRADLSVTLALVRHGRTAWNLERRLQGRSDIALDAHGELQAHAAGRLLARARWGSVITSPLTRAAQTAAIVGSHLGVPEPAVEPGLLERDFGRAEGMRVAEAAERWPGGDYPGSETAAQLAERAGEALTALLGAPGTAVVVSHGVFLRAGIEAVTGATCPRILNGQVVLLEPAAGRPTARFLGE
ncbi:hypothetical protein C5E07_18180 [Pseudoclavibacter sp. RFBJ3]|nr:hypothetical protein C5C12_18120 [Pseudoclavibacter sp. RFBJ5]PPF89163.1 hypothetical protein C5E07_18180 [Pseudoclavibacter sp. RFBJ3]PPF95788.1 hypothetical protein C5C19_17380 [Pseudoclavibacter sp. RFBH5]PPG25939.1 hypothetical protein C5E13_01025 [Pseudoclavibacter sp. RFBI4]